MTEQTDDQASNSAPSAEPDSSQAAVADTSSPAPRPARGARVIAIIALLLALAAAGVSGYLWYQVQVEQRIARNQALTDIQSTASSATASVTALEKEINALRARQNEFGTRIDAQIKTRLDELEGAQQKLVDRYDSLAGSIEKVYDDLDRSLDSWALEEVEQLLRIANHSLRLSGDISTAIAGLELADQRLEELANPAFLPVRERLADNLAALKSLDPVDTPGISLRLSKMASRVEALPLAQETERPVNGGADAATDEPQGNGWLEAGSALLDDLSKLVRIQNTDAPAKPLLTTEQRYFLYNNLQLMLSGAQIAALRQDTATFEANLAQAQSWLRDYFDTDHQGVKQMLADIEDLRGTQLDPELPDISDSLNALREVKQRVTSQ